MKVRTAVVRDDFRPRPEPAERILLIQDQDPLQDGTHTSLQLAPDNCKAGAVCFLRLFNGYGDDCISLNLEAAVALNRTLDMLVDEYIEATHEKR